MAEANANVDADYDSDVSEGTPALALRRREASDDEEDVTGRMVAGSLEEEEDDEYLDDDVVVAVDSNPKEDEDVYEEADEGVELEEFTTELGQPVKKSEAVNRGEDEKKDSEPFIVPTAGPFYMHDDRFRDSGGARPRRGMGARRLWESRDEKPWVHDLFEELSIQDNAEGYRRRGRGRGRGRGRFRGRGSRVNYDDGSHSSAGSRAFKTKNDENKNRESTDQQQMTAKKQTTSLSSSSPPFYPSGTVSPLPVAATMTPPDDSSGLKKLTASSSAYVPKSSAQRMKQTNTERINYTKPQQQLQPNQNSEGRERRWRGNTASGFGRGNVVSNDLGIQDSVYDPAIMQYGTQSQAGVALPGAAMGMTVPNFSGQQAYGFGNSEITWVPVLSGGANGVGTGFVSPYMAMDYQQPSVEKYMNDGNMHADLGSEERHNKPRRYSEMKFGH